MKGYISNDKNLIHLPWQYLPQSDGGVCDEGSGAKSQAGITSREEIGNPVYPPARRKLAEHGISCEGHAARQLTQRDYDAFDLLIGMDQENLWNIRRICGGDPEGKIHLLLDFTSRPGSVADPWYTGDFETTWRDVDGGCRALLGRIQAKEQNP